MDAVDDESILRSPELTHSGTQLGEELARDRSHMPSGCSRWGVVTVFLGIMLLLVTLVYLYEPALRLPVALVDEALYLNNSDRVWKKLPEIGFIEALRRDIFTVERGYKPGAPIFYAMWYELCHENRTCMHAILLGLLLTCMGGIVVVPWLYARWLQDSRVPSWMLIGAGVVGAFFFIAPDVPNWSGLQSLRVNWYRLHTSESLIVCCLVAHSVLLLIGLSSKSKRWRVILTCVAVAFLALGGTFKPTAFATLVPPFFLSFLLAKARRPGWIVLSLASAVTVLLSALYLVGLHSLTPPTPSSGYFTSYMPKWETIRESRIFQFQSFNEMLGPLFPLLVPAIFSRWICQCQRKEQWRLLLERNSFLLYFLAQFITFVCVFLPWPHFLPRYLLTAHVMLCLAIASEVFLWCQWIIETQPARRFSLLGVLLGLGMTLTLPGRLAQVFLVILASISRLLRCDRLVQGAIAAILIVSAAYLGIFVFYSRDAIFTQYVKKEMVNCALRDYILSHNVREKVIGYMGDVDNDERVASLRIYARREHKQNLQIKPVFHPSDLSGVDLLLVEETRSHVMPLPPEFPRLTPSATFYGPPKVLNPISFWRWRERLWNHQWGPPLEPFKLSLGWTIYSVPKSP
jgi:hypothetical protein